MYTTQTVCFSLYTELKPTKYKPSEIDITASSLVDTSPIVCCHRQTIHKRQIVQTKIKICNLYKSTDFIIQWSVFSIFMKKELSLTVTKSRYPQVNNIRAMYNSRKTLCPLYNDTRKTNIRCLIEFADESYPEKCRENYHVLLRGPRPQGPFLRLVNTPF